MAVIRKAGALPRRGISVEAVLAERAASYPFGRVLSPADIAGVVSFLAALSGMFCAKSHARKNTSRLTVIGDQAARRARDRITLSGCPQSAPGAQVAVVRDGSA
jgi:hypothetical protein